MITETEDPGVLKTGVCVCGGGGVKFFFPETIMLCNDFRVMKARLFLQFENMAENEKVDRTSWLALYL